ncbi:MAG: HisA/HisF-related TIM barrel protein, partial [Roseiarcus sp.]
MEIIPVIDLKDATVVRARLGRRDEYLPIETRLSPTSDPVDVARGLLSVHPFKTFYVADLDAIEGKGDNYASLARLKAAFPDLAFWVDNGILDLDAAQTWLASQLGHLVLGSETQVNDKLVR